MKKKSSVGKYKGNFILCNETKKVKRCILCNNVIGKSGRPITSGFCLICSQDMRTGCFGNVAVKINKLKEKIRNEKRK